MFSCLLTLAFYVTCTSLVAARCSTLSSRLLGIGALPVVWISLCGIAGLLDTLFGLPPLFLLGLAVISFVIATIKIRRSSISLREIRANDRSSWVIGLGLLCFLAVATFAHLHNPWGSWDSMFTWVLRARFFAIGGSQWKNAFSNDLALLHPDYPPMLSWALNALWRVDGQINTVAIATLFTPLWPAFVCLVFGFQCISTDRIRLDFSTAVLLGTPIIWRLANSMLADFALSYSILGSCAFYCFGMSKQNHYAISIASFFATWSGLIKNEGLTWSVAFLVVTLGISRLSRFQFNRQTGARLISGAMIPLMAIMLFKAILAPPNDLVVPTRASEIGEVVQPGVLVGSLPLMIRLGQIEIPIYHIVVWTQLFIYLHHWETWGLTLWWWLALFLLRFWRPGIEKPLLKAIYLQLVVYYLVYIISPYHLHWHLFTSLDRVLTHIVPASLCLFAFDIRSHSVAEENANKAALPQPFGAVWTCRVAFAYFLAISIGSWLPYLLGKEKLSEEPRVNLKELREIGIPSEPVISYVSSNLGTRDLYVTQFAAVPTVLVVDRREKMLLARFADEAELRRYCDENRWILIANRGGLGWARDDDGQGLKQPVKLQRME